MLSIRGYGWVPSETYHFAIFSLQQALKYFLRYALMLMNAQMVNTPATKMHSVLIPPVDSAAIVTVDSKVMASTALISMNAQWEKTTAIVMQSVSTHKEVSLVLVGKC